jgi:hypothetical protein
MAREVVDNRHDLRNLRGKPSFDLLEKVEPAFTVSLVVEVGERCPGGRYEGAVDVDAMSPTVVFFVDGTPFGVTLSAWN